MKIVFFKDGTYGIRKGWFKSTYRYVDLKSWLYPCPSEQKFTWPVDNKFFYDCKGGLELVTKVYNMTKKPKVKPPKPDYGIPLDLTTNCYNRGRNK